MPAVKEDTGMKPRKRRKKGIRWYRAELRHIREVADEALERNQSGPVWDCAERQGIALVAISAMAADAAVGREAYLER
jgi:hypothetical protein